MKLGGQMYNIAICDDEEICARMNHDLILNYKMPPGVNYSVEVFTEGQKLLNNAIRFDIIILDIDMPVLDGMEVARLLRKNGYDKYIVFVTSHTAPVFDAFKYNAFRYLVKPIDQNQMTEALNSIFNDIQEKNDNYINIDMDSNNIVRVNIDDIRFLESFNRKVIFHLSKQDLVAAMKMKEVEALLNEYDFYKTHKSFIVNMKYVQSFNKMNVILMDENVVPLSRLKLSSFKLAFHEYIKEH